MSHDSKQSVVLFSYYISYSTLGLYFSLPYPNLGDGNQGNKMGLLKTYLKQDGEGISLSNSISKCSDTVVGSLRIWGYRETMGREAGGERLFS